MQRPRAAVVTEFREKVYAVVRNIPKGSVMSYGDVARAAGHPGAARAVGTVLSKNYDPLVPCHRVIRRDGRVGQYNRGSERKQALLVAEGAI